MKTRLLSLLAVTAAFFVSLGTAQAQQVNAANPESVVRYLQDKGYRALIETREDGSQVLKTALNGWEYSIYFVDCDAERVCHSLQFLLGFDLPNGTTLAAANDFNFRYMIGTASLDDENDPWLEWLVSTRGGLTASNFDDVMEWWATAINLFEQSFPFEEPKDKSEDSEADQ